MRSQVLYYRLMRDLLHIQEYKGGKMNTMNERIAAFGVVPVVVLEDAKDAKPLADALVKGDCLARKSLSVQMQQRNPSGS